MYISIQGVSFQLFTLQAFEEPGASSGSGGRNQKHLVLVAICLGTRWFLPQFPHLAGSGGWDLALPNLQKSSLPQDKIKSRLPTAHKSLNGPVPPLGSGHRALALLLPIFLFKSLVPCSKDTSSGKSLLQTFHPRCGFALWPQDWERPHSPPPCRWLPTATWWPGLGLRILTLWAPLSAAWGRCSGRCGRHPASGTLGVACGHTAQDRQVSPAGDFDF